MNIVEVTRRAYVARNVQPLKAKNTSYIILEWFTIAVNSRKLEDNYIEHLHIRYEIQDITGRFILEIQRNEF